MFTFIAGVLSTLSLGQSFKCILSSRNTRSGLLMIFFIFFWAFAISRRQTLDFFHVQFGLPYIQHLFISHTTQHPHLEYMGHPPTPRFIGHLSFHGLGWTPFAHIHHIVRLLRLQLMADVLGMNHELAPSPQWCDWLIWLLRFVAASEVTNFTMRCCVCSKNQQMPLKRISHHYMS